MSEGNQISPQQTPEDKLSTALTVVSFCIPIVGAILYFTNKDASPNKAKSALKAALIGFGVGIVLNILFRVMGQG